MKNLRLTTYDLRLKGFTLLELLIAASIFSIIILSIYSAFQTGILSYRKVDSAFEVYQSARIVLNRMELDLKNSFVYSDTRDSRFKGGEASLDFFTVVDSYKEGNPTTNICRIRYELKGKTLMRTVYMGLGALKEEPETPLESELALEVKEISLQYAYKKDADSEISWLTSWPDSSNTDETVQTEQKQKLPVAVKVKLSLIERDRHKQEIGVVEFNKIVSLPVDGGSADAE